MTGQTILKEICEPLDNLQDLESLLCNDSDFFSVYDKVTLHFKRKQYEI